MTLEGFDLEELSKKICGQVTVIDTDISHWVVVCVQDPGHDGPHVGMVSWHD
jgi:hypothetical protein